MFFLKVFTFIFQRNLPNIEILDLSHNNIRDSVEIQVSIYIPDIIIYVNNNFKNFK